MNGTIAAAAQQPFAGLDIMKCNHMNSEKNRGK